MPRPVKLRQVCALPVHDRFAPVGQEGADAVVQMTVDEYEVIRLIDWEQMTQQECSERMQVARTTVQAIYDTARRKLADCLVNGRALQIVGGCYQVCSGYTGGCCGRGCPKGHGCNREAACGTRRCRKKQSAKPEADKMK